MSGIGVRRIPIFIAVLLLPVGALRAEDESPAEGPAPYLRVARDAKHLALEVAVRELARPGTTHPRIWLVGVIHIADKGYYRAVQRVLDLPPVVLYESVMPPGVGRLRTGTPQERVLDTQARLAFLASLVNGIHRRGLETPATEVGLRAAVAKVDPRLGHFLRRCRLDAWGGSIRYAPSEQDVDEGGATAMRFTSLGADGKPGGEDEAADLEAAARLEVPPERASDSAPFGLQERLAAALGLTHQGAGIDYARADWTPSDMSIDELRRAAEARGGDMEVLEELLAGSGLRGAFVRVALGVLAAANVLTGGAARDAVKIAFIEALGRADGEPNEGGIDAATMKALIDDRDAVVIEDLKRLLSNRPRLPSVAIFYGAGHMRDLEARLGSLGFAPRRTWWLRAIDVDLAASGVSRVMVEAIRRSLDDSLGD